MAILPGIPDEIILIIVRDAIAFAKKGMETNEIDIQDEGAIPPAQ
ncbi:MAG: hypothetical protein P8L82_08365 [Paracoccaceae bacterium]|nr:hypothetical protein [Paracoccaceae bacterium]